METNEIPSWFSAITCCLSEDKHLIHDAVVLKCGGKACAKCTQSSSKCNRCQIKHDPVDENLLIRDSLVEIFMQTSYSTIIQYLNTQYQIKQQDFKCDTKGALFSYYFYLNCIY
jgi:hypothetical protein